MQRGKKILIAVICILIVVLGIQMHAGYQIYQNNCQRATNERTSDEVLVDWLINDKNYDVETFRASYQNEEIAIESSLGTHSIPATYIYAPSNTDKTGHTIIMVHGLLGNRISNYPVAEMFLKQGYNVITYDQRSSGGNLAPHTTFGYLESQDLTDYIAYADKQMAWAQVK